MTNKHSNQFYQLEPEVAGSLGKNCVINTCVHPPIVSKLEYQLEGWQGDALIESFPCYLITHELADRLIQAELSGYRLAECRIVLSACFTKEYATNSYRALPRRPEFKWMQITGKAGLHDIGLSDTHMMVVSKGALKILTLCPLHHCDIEEYRVP